MPFVILFAALYLLLIAFLMDTKNMPSFFILKFLPFILGLILGAHAVKSLGWLAFL